MLASPAVDDLFNKNKHHTIIVKVPGCTTTSQMSGSYVTMSDSSFRSITNPVYIYVLLRC